MSIKVCFVDFETTGVDPKKCSPIELGAIMFNYKGSWNSLLDDVFQTYINGVLIPKEIEELTGISNEIIEADGISPFKAISRFHEFAEDAVYFIAHNVDFDLEVLKGIVDRTNPGEDFGYILDRKNWICTLKDIDYPRRFTCKKLSHLALDHGLTVDGSKSHGAIADVELILEILRAGKYDLHTILKNKNESHVYLRANITKPWEDDGKQKQEAIEHGFKWDAQQKFWVKKIRRSMLDEERKLKVSFQRVLIHTEKTEGDNE